MSKWFLVECYTISDISKMKYIIKSLKARLKDFIVNKDNTCSLCIEYDDQKIIESIELLLNTK